jgi:ER lumen protein retaining receptor
MNIFSLSGDLLHLLSIFILLLKVYTQKSCRGISLKTQILYVVVFCTRYLDLFWNFHSLYNSVMKVIFILSSSAIVYLMAFKTPINKTYDAHQDSLNLLYLLVPCALLALLINEYFGFAEVCWTFSIYLEAVAIVPQLVVIHSMARAQNGFVEQLTSDYVFCLGGYRALYLVNWIYRVLTEPHYSMWIVWIAGMVQTLIYCDFFFYYAKAKMKGEKMSLPI